MTDNGERILLATSATGPHPFPSRTRSLSLSAPMVLRLRGRGRVGRRQLPKAKRRRVKTSRRDVAQRRHASTVITVLRDAFVLGLCATSYLWTTILPPPSAVAASLSSPAPR